jgi:hypothetical protein
VQKNLCKIMQHTKHNRMNSLREVFEERVISQGLWPLLLPGLIPRAFYLWSTLKEKLYMNNPHSLGYIQ